MEARVLRSLGPQRAPMVLTGVFAAVALALAVTGVYGVYGVLTSTVTQRVGDFGVRMALGARAGDVVRMVLGEGARVIALGVAGALALGRLLASQIGEVNPADPVVIAGAVVSLAAAALLASYLPARRAARIEPMRALRTELMDALYRNVRQALRARGRTPGATATILLTLALGIGASSAVFAVLDAVVLRALVFASGRLLSSALYGVRPSDPAVLGGVALIVVTVASAAALLPAARAARIDPMQALRDE